MKLGVISQNLTQFEFEEGLKYAQDLGLQAMEVGACGLWNQKYCDVTGCSRTREASADGWRHTTATASRSARSGPTERH